MIRMFVVFLPYWVLLIVVVRKKQRRKFTMFLVNGTLDLAVRLMKRHQISYKVCLLVFYLFFVSSARSVYEVSSDNFYLFFTELPGVIFVLPDSYVDAENQDYGGMDTVLTKNFNLTVYMVSSLYYLSLHVLYLVC